MASADYTVLVPERVTLEYDVAGLGSRGVAVLIDTAIQVGALMVLAAMIGAGGALLFRNGGISLPEGAGTLAIGLASLVLFLVANGYYALFEIVWNGQTPGKRAVGVRVIRESGYAVRPGDAIVRNLVRIVDWLPLAYGLGVSTMLVNSRFRRLGDLAAGTIVIREAPSLPISTASAIRRSEPSDSRFDSRTVGHDAVAASISDARPKVLLAPADAILLRDFLVRRHELEPTPRRQLGANLASSICRRYGLTAPAADSSPEQFIESLV